MIEIKFPKSKISNLRKALGLLLKHRKEMDDELWKGIHVKALGIKRNDGSKNNLKKWFILATGPGWRAGPALSFKKRKKMLKAFDKWYKKVTAEILIKYSGQEAIDKMIEKLMKIKGVGPKIATTYLKDVIYRLGAWPELKEYLYLPIDRHTRNILINKIKIFNNDEVPAIGESYFTKKNKNFQKILNEIHRPRADFDFFWYIGSKFCAYYLCDFCWIKKACRAKSKIF